MIIDHHELNHVRKYAGEQTIALTVGCFDIVHEGHVKQLNAAKEEGDILVVAVMPDEFIEKRKGPDRPIFDQNYRVQNIDGAEPVDFSFIAPPTSLALAHTVFRLRPDVFVEHEEHKEKAGRARLIKRLILGALAVDLVVTTDEKINSTTAILQQFGCEGARARSLTFAPETTSDRRSMIRYT